MLMRLVALGCACVWVLSACGNTATAPAETDSAVADATVDPGDASPADTAGKDSENPGDTGVSLDSGTVEDGAAELDAADVTVTADTAADTAVVDTTDTAVADTPDTAEPDTTEPDTTQPDLGPLPVDAGPLYKVTSHSSACKSDGDCTIPCATGLCLKGTCEYDVGGGCLVPTSAGKVTCYPSGTASKTAACLRCSPEISKSALTSVTKLVPFEKSTEGWTVKDLSGSGINWNLNKTRTVDSGFSLYLGDPDSAVYANDKHVNASVTTAAMLVPKHDGVNPAMQFWLYLDTEQTKGYDFLTVAVLQDKAGAKPEQVFNSDSIGGTTSKVWQLRKIDLGKWAGKSVKFVFTFDTLDGFVNAFEGVYIDKLTIRTGCCGSAVDCNDGNACSTDTCAPSKASKDLPVCGFSVKKECCSSSADCDDGKPCTLDLCSGPGGTCSHNAKPNCCMTTTDCDDKDSCTLDHCPKAGANCQHTNTCCKADAECTNADPCLVGKCTGGDCAFTNTCCSVDSECDDFNPCTIDACNKGKCLHSPSKAPGCCALEPVIFEFDYDLEGWKSDGKTTKGLIWHQGTYQGIASEPNNGNGVMKFGIPGKAKFDKLTGSSYLYVTSPVIELAPSQQYTVEIKYKFDLNYKTTSNYLYQYYLVDGKQINSYYNYSQKEYYYKNHKVDGWDIWKKDISAFAGRKFQIKLRGRIYGYSNKPQSGQGTLIDYVKITTTCNAKICSGNSSCTPASTSCQGGKGICNAGNCAYAQGCCKSSADCISPTLCSVGVCSGSTCKFAEKKNCCMAAGDCDDGNPCTLDACPGPGKQCTHTSIAGCCLNSGECDDKKACTQDTCINSKCTYADICCKTDGECDDKDDKCTTDKCGANGLCAYTSTGAKGCCSPDLWSNDFSSSLKGIKTANSKGPSQGWQLWTNATLSKSPKGVLYYGNKSTKNYNFGVNNGKATTPEISLPAGKSTTLSLWLFQATELSSSFDQTFITLRTATGSATQIWSKKSFGFGGNKWLPLKFDLKKWAGQKVRIEFSFNTKDSLSNNTLGVLIDDLKFTVKCD